MPEVFTLNRPASESTALRAVISGGLDGGTTSSSGAFAFKAMSNTSVAKLASSSASFKQLATPSLPTNPPLSLQIFDKPAKEFRDVTAEIKAKLPMPKSQLQAVESTAPSPSLLSPPPPPKDPFLQRLHNVYLTTEYLDNFPKELECLEISKEELKNKTDEELTSLVKQIRIILGSTQTGAFISSSIDKAVGIMESVAIENGYLVEGLSNILKRDEDWRKLCKEAELAYCDMLNLSVEQRIALKVFQTGAALHEMNRVKRAYQSDETTLDEEIVNEFKDLVE
jgi:hypothetical protein